MNLQSKANDIRLQTFQCIYNAGGGHFGGSLSAIEILTVLYYDALNLKKGDPKWSQRDRFVLAKGHAGPPLYVILADLGYIAPTRLAELDQNGGSLPKHVDRLKVEGIDYSSGPLGQGLSVACGMAAAARLDNLKNDTYVLMGDGELDEGQVWEAAMTAAHYRLDHLIAFVDRNRNQIDGTTEDVMALEPLADKWRAFGWDVQVIDGHNTGEIQTAIQRAKAAFGKPSMIIANTIKGKGVPFMENRFGWHSGQMNEAQYALGQESLKGRCAQ